MYFLRQLRKFNLHQELMVRFYRAIIESVITTWGSSATKHDLHRLQRIIRSAERTVGRRSDFDALTARHSRLFSSERAG
ncbi:hypothetical protein AOLI_G00092340 [Acnodon oligacanthus]